MTKKEFGKWLSTARNSLQLSQDQMAKSLGLAGKELAKIEAGIVEFPKSKMQALGLVLKVEKKFELQLKVIFYDDKKDRKAG